MEGVIGYKIISSLLRAEPPLRLSYEAIKSFVESNSRALKFVSIGVFGLCYYLIKTYKEKNVLFRQLQQEKVKTRQLEQQRAVLGQDFDNELFLWEQGMAKKMKLERERANLVEEKNALSRQVKNLSKQLEKEKVKTRQSEKQRANLVKEKNALSRQVKNLYKQSEKEKVKPRQSEQQKVNLAR